MFHFALGLVDLLGAGNGEPLFEDCVPPAVAAHVRVVALCISIFCGLCFVLVLPLAAVQCGNICLSTTTFARFAHPHGGPDSSSSMLMQDSSMFGALVAPTASASLEVRSRRCCCYWREQPVSELRANSLEENRFN